MGPGLRSAGARCAGVACRGRGYQARGTVIVRPSARSTLRLSSEKRTPRINAPALGSEVVIPCPQQVDLIVHDQALHRAQLSGGESQGTSAKPELCGDPISIDMNMRWLADVVTHEVYAVRPRTQNCRHSNAFDGSKHVGRAPDSTAARAVQDVRVDHRGV